MSGSDDEGQMIVEPYQQDDDAPGVWIGHTSGRFDAGVEIQVFEPDDIWECVLLEHHEIPDVIEALAERATPSDLDEIRQRIVDVESIVPPEYDE